MCQEGIVSLEPISCSTLADGVESSILSFIRRRTLQPGDLLPREEEIADDLNISRLSVREGIGRLKALGLIEPRKRRGTILRKPDPFLPFSKIARTNLFTQEDRRDFRGMRVALELGMCEWIFFRKKPEDIRKLRKIALEITNVWSDVEFHTQLMKMSGNHSVNEFREILAEFFKFPPKECDREFWQKSSKEHLELCDILEKGTAAEFYAAMRKHFQPYFNDNIS